MFIDIYFRNSFQSHLVLVVFDEAHMIYVWGLVASGKIKGIVSHVRISNQGLFCPSYGKLGARLMATNGALLLLMSATCRPVAIACILNVLRLMMPQVHFVRAE
jgi:superfamily II DNA helicase RecQ